MSYTAADTIELDLFADFSKEVIDLKTHNISDHPIHSVSRYSGVSSWING